MSNFVNLGTALQPQLNRLKEIAKAKGINLENLPTKESLEKRVIEKANESLEKKRKQWIYSQSLYSGDIPIKFNSSKWDVNKQPNKQKAKDLGNQAYKLAKKMAVKPMNVLLIGDRGVGKTSLALMMLDELKKTGKSVMFVSTVELAGLFEYVYEYEDVKERIKRIIVAMQKADVLLLDDFGTEGGMKNDVKPVRQDMQRKLYQVFNSRIDFENNTVKKSTIITTNNIQQELERMYNVKLISRLIPKNKEQRLAFNGMEEVRGV